MLVLSQLIFPLKLYLFELRVHRTLNGLEAGKAATSTSAFSFLNGLALMLLGYKMATTKLPYQLKTGNPFSFESEDYHSDPLHGSEKRDFQKSSPTCEHGCLFRSRPEPKQDIGYHPATIGNETTRTTETGYENQVSAREWQPSGNWEAEEQVAVIEAKKLHDF